MITMGPQAQRVLRETAFNILRSAIKLRIIACSLSLKDGTDPSLSDQEPVPPKPHPFPGYPAQICLESRVEADEKFFKGMLEDVDKPTLPFGLTKVDNGYAEVNEAHQSLSQDLNDRLRLQTKQLQVSLATICHVAWAQVLARTSGQPQVVFGTVLPGRLRVGVGSQNASELSMNTLPFRCDIDKRSALECVQDTHSRLSALLEHEHASLALARRCSGITACSPLFCGLLRYRHSSPSSSNIPGASDVTHVSHEEWFQYPDLQPLGGQGCTNYPFGLSVDDFGTSINLTVQVIHAVDPTRISAYMQRSLESLVEALEGMRDTPIQTLEVIPMGERQMLLEDWNATQQDHPEGLCLHHLFEKQVERTPEAIAVMHDDQSMTYAELNARANCLAHRLITFGVRPDMLIAICVERSFAMITGLLGILKAGAAYVPLDPFYSSDRLRDILRDAAVTILVADKTGRIALGEKALSSLAVVDPDNTLRQEGSGNPEVAELASRHLAYVMYTSGSIGNPIGVMHEHRGVVNSVYSLQMVFNVCPSSRVLQFASLGFAHSVFEIFTTLTTGASLCLVQDEFRLDRHRLCGILMRCAITHFSFTPSLLQDCKDAPVMKSLRTLIIIGEAVPTSLLEVLQTMAPKSTIINSYGLTETMTDVLWTCPRGFIGDVVPMGRPIPNKRIYILDVHGNPVPLGVIGEMYIGGIGLARGYLNLPELTEERFLPDRFDDESAARMYKTGDLARYLPDGNLVYLGRNDNQIKIRGFRVEPGEIEARLTEHPLVSKAMVVALGEGSDKRLVAYMIIKATDGMDSPSTTTLRSHLATRLPEYMIPAATVHLKALPLTANGKLNRGALPTPGDSDYARQPYEEPQGKVENILASIWSDLLRVERVSRHDSFFALGGHSLLAMKLTSHLRHLGSTVPVRQLYESPILSEFAQSFGQLCDLVVPRNLITPGINRITPDMLPLIDLNQTDIDRIVELVPGGAANIQDIYALSPLQEGILFHHIMAKNGDPYVLFLSMSFESRESLDQYLTTMQQIIDRHDILRTSLIWESLSTPAQIVWRQAPLSITELQLDPAAGPIAEQLKQMFDPRSYRMALTQAPLLRFIAAQEGAGHWLLFELQHHLLGDQSTLMIKHLELEAFSRGQGTTLPPASPYRNFIAQVRLRVSNEEHERFFKEMLGEIDTPSIPFGITDIRGDEIEVTESRRMLSQDLNNRLQVQARRLGISVARLCHVAWALVIARTSGQQRIVFGTVLLGRKRTGASSDQAMGLFINTLPIRVDLESDSVEGCVRATHARISALLEHEHAPLTLAQRSSSVAAGMPLFSALLNYRRCLPLDELKAANRMTLLGSHERTNYPFCLLVEDYGTSRALIAQVVQPLNPARVCSYMHEALNSLASALEYSPNMCVSKLEVLPMDERQMLLRNWNATQEEYPDHLYLHHLFEKQVDSTPDAIAVVHGDQSLTYLELNNRANRLAHQLIQLDVKPDSLVAICVERSFSMIVGIMGILKAGGAYIPLDPSHTSDRLYDIINDTAPICVVADGIGRTAIGDVALSSLSVVDPNSPATDVTCNPSIPMLTSRHLAYVIYTSGSTGKPKGVMVEHQ
ncbi:hypothetical protein BGX28_005469, partial [Mortierella sp. GBA30]